MLKKTKLSDILNQSFFKPYLIDGELETLLIKWPKTTIYSTTLKFEQDHFNYWSKIVCGKKNKRGEVLFAIQHGKKYLVHTKKYYPNSAFRLLTGGIHKKEPVFDALTREVAEETSMQIVDSQLFAILFYTFINGEKTIPFVSYMFKVCPDNYIPVVQDDGENISDFQWANLSQMIKIISGLTNLPKDWKDWGKMRSIPHKILINNF
jgi:8-oxo-dGTP pyrophosphatase MutT (NUDIX family)